MAYTSFHHNDFVKLVYEVMFAGVTAPAASKYYLCLLSGSSFSRTSTMVDLIGAELPNANGSVRKQITYTAGAGAYNNTTQRYELGLKQALWTASADFTFRTVLLLANAAIRSADSFALAGFNTGTGVVTVASHLLVNGDSFLITPDAGSTLPSGLSATTLYKAVSVSGNDFRVSTDGTTPISLGTGGSGTFKLRYANGTPVMLSINDSDVLVQSGLNLRGDLTLVDLNATFGNGV